MKKTLCITLALITILLCFTGCNFYANTSGDLAGDAEAEPYVSEMIVALAQDNMSDAKALMHPDASKNVDDNLAQMSNYLDGRKAVSIEQTDISVKVSNGTKGKVRQEQLTYTVTLDDGEEINLLISYLSDKESSGFTKFQIVLGVD